ncbi:Alpha/beta knot methyltransferase [Fimicolochytrium jonesii]|uniref:Alpha/beta knot methyltransferase n=1 Tax=Fimicolochytrium jonesii TaxID=1396493 RepID=UPI0022FECE8E|nr:Alpha/beta knot methyltransferase [Fimicolochytrium jonesii]KAI8825785.1 Alpha/beta knot methyltransferase [Fimicolochytrium jonesii]
MTTLPRHTRCLLAQLLSLPSRSYRSATSNRVEHLYGAASVLPALQSGRRKLKRLYVKDRGGSESARGRGRGFIEELGEDDGGGGVLAKALAWARRRELVVTEVPGTRLETMSDNRPNQARSRLMALSQSTSLQLSNTHLVRRNLLTGWHRRYPAIVTKREIIPLSFSGVQRRRRFPLWLALDQVMDPQNLGGILRSAHFFGVDGVILTEHESASFTPTVSKASSGAMEVMELYVTPSLPKFLETSAENGWHIFGTDINKPNTISLSTYARARTETPVDELPVLLNSPTILVLGSEGTGLRAVVSNVCHDHLVIGDFADEDDDIGKAADSRVRDTAPPDLYTVDSLNVSVAAGILLHTLVTS